MNWKETKVAIVKSNKKIYEINFDINYFVRVRAKNKDEAIDKISKMNLSRIVEQSEPHNIEIAEAEEGKNY